MTFFLFEWRMLSSSIAKALLIYFFSGTAALLAQQELLNKHYQFTAYEHLATWKGVASNWQKDKATIHLFDINTYKGHSSFVCYGLKTGLKFTQFKELVRHPQKRQYLPLFVYDLREQPLIREGKSYTWALRLEDYSYTDDQASMEQAFLRLMQTAQQQFKIGEGIAILASTSTVQPNFSIKNKLEKAGYKVMTLTQLITATTPQNPSPQKTTASKGFPKVEILNEGIAVGYLTYVKSGQEHHVNSNFEHILLYEQLPYRVPIANGILTLSPQTPFSHINLLAKNRKTVNAYFGSTLPPDFLKNHEGQLVKIEAQKKEDKNDFVIQKISLAEAQNHWNQQKRLKVNIPEPDLSVKAFSHFNKGSKSVQTVHCIGAKASNYALLYHHLPEYTRLGFAIPFYFYVETIQSCGANLLIDELLENKENWSTKRIKEQLEVIRARIQQAILKEPIYKELEWILDNYYKGKKIRLRSSTNCEDLPSFNGAGLYVSKGFWEGSGRAVLEQKILEVYASLWLDRAFEEREFFGINHQKAAMAILIHEAFPNEYANGVALTLPNPTGGSSIHINSQIGEASVTNPEGTAQPEMIYFRALDSPWYVTQATSSIEPVFVDNAALTPLARQLQRACAEINTLLKKNIPQSENYGVDIEFKIMKEDKGYHLYIKQARLLDVLSPQ